MADHQTTGNASRATLPTATGPLKALREFLHGLRRWRRAEEPTLKEAIEEYIVEAEEARVPIDQQERTLLDNIANLGERAAGDVMVPRADIVAVEAGTSLAELIKVMREGAHSRLPVYRENLDEVIGMVHIKDVLAYWDRPEAFRLTRVVRPLLFVVPSTRVLDLLRKMRVTRTHLALVVDEYGGIDGLITIEDVVEEIVGEIEDEHDRTVAPRMVALPDGTIDADARTPVEEFEARVGPVLSDDEREDIDTLGGLVFSLAGRVPARGELIAHASGIEFEVLEADPRRIKRLRVRNLPPGAGSARS